MSIFSRLFNKTAESEGKEPTEDGADAGDVGEKERMRPSVPTKGAGPGRCAPRLRLSKSTRQRKPRQLSPLRLQSQARPEHRKRRPHPRSSGALCHLSLLLSRRATFAPSRPAMPVAYGDSAAIPRSRWGPMRLSAVWCPKELLPRCRPPHPPRARAPPKNGNPPAPGVAPAPGAPGATSAMRAPLGSRPKFGKEADSPGKPPPTRAAEPRESPVDGLLTLELGVSQTPSFESNGASKGQASKARPLAQPRPAERARSLDEPKPAAPPNFGRSSEPEASLFSDLDAAFGAIVDAGVRAGANATCPLAPVGGLERRVTRSLHGARSQSHASGSRLHDRHQMGGCPLRLDPDLRTGGRLAASGPRKKWS